MDGVDRCYVVGHASRTTEPSVTASNQEADRSNGVRTWLACCVLLLFLVATAGSASAQGAVLIRGPAVGDLVAGPVIAGDGIAWIADAGRERRFIHADSRGRRVLGRWRPGRGEGADLAASSEIVAVQRWAYRCPSAGCRRRAFEELLVGSIDGPLSRVAACGLPGAAACGPRCHAGRVLSVAGRTVAWRFDCSGPLRLRERQGSERSIAAGLGAQLAGRFVASDELTPRSGMITVRDVDTGAERLRVDATVNRFDLDEDGAVVFSRLAGGDVRSPESDIFIATPQVPEPRRLAHVLGGTPGLSLAGGLVAWTSGGIQGGAPQITVARRDGTRVAGGPAPDLTFPLSFDGRRLAWAVLPCRRFRFAVWSLQGPPPAQRGGCGRLRVRSARLSHDRRSVRLAVRCPKAPLGGCGVTLSGSLRGKGERVAVLEEQIVGFEPGARTQVLLALRKPRRIPARAITLRLQIVEGPGVTRRRTIAVPLR